MIVGLGIDLVETARVERLLRRWGDSLLAKLMDPSESALLPTGPDRSSALSLAIAGKEAASKALGTGWTRGVRWRDVVVELRSPPAIRLQGGAAEVARRLGSAAGRTRVSLEIRGELALGEVWLLS